ncbi:MAG: hypothetical protein CL920_22435 [Deltaproteobacteria bacterium]|nr:hypothetical protein [Deltaproteobacteria bacterium]MBU51457.1 hypothetical protein [Deltaproteobacteria bacterium]
MSEFLKRVMKRMPKQAPASYTFESWDFGGKPTKEGFGILPVSGLDVDAFMKCVLDLDHYVGNLDFVEECRTIEDARFDANQSRCYQRLKLPVIGGIHQEFLMTDAGEMEGYRVAYWEMLEDETMALNPKQAIRNQYNDGAWIVMDGAIGYALSTAPVRKDVGFLAWKAMTKGGDAGAKTVVKSTIESMVKWSKK